MFTKQAAGYTEWKAQSCKTNNFSVSTVKYSVFALLGNNNSNFCYQPCTVKLTSMLILLSVVNDEFKLCLIYIIFFHMLE